MSNIINLISQNTEKIRTLVFKEGPKLLKPFLGATKGMTGPQAAVICTTIGAGGLATAVAIHEAPQIIQTGIDGEICGKKICLHAPHRGNEVSEEEK